MVLVYCTLSNAFIDMVTAKKYIYIFGALSCILLVVLLCTYVSCCNMHFNVKNLNL